MTQEGFDLLKKLVFADINPEDYHNRHPLPNAFRDEAENWWNMEDWGEYYKAFVGKEPEN
jgi:MoxR-like ATPase